MRFSDLDNLEIQTCSSIDVLLSTPKGQESRAAEFHRDVNLLFVQERFGRPKCLGGYPAHSMSRSTPGRVLDQMQKRARSKLLLQVRAEDELAGKLVLAVGADALKARLPRTAIDDLEKAKRGPLGGTELAELSLSVHGYHILSELRRELADARLEPPERWAGSREARRFVESLGFPVDLRASRSQLVGRIGHRRSRRAQATPQLCRHWWLTGSRTSSPWREPRSAEW